jgi:hypothetical protein
MDSTDDLLERRSRSALEPGRPLPILPGKPAQFARRGAAAVADAATGGNLPLPAGNFTALKVLAAAVGGNQANQTFTVTYTDGTVTVVPQSLSDWFTPQSYAGESKASTMAYRLLPTGAADNRTFYLYGYSFAINNTKTVASITLPAGRHVVVLAMTLVP